MKYLLITLLTIFVSFSYAAVDPLDSVTPMGVDKKVKKDSESAKEIIYCDGSSDPQCIPPKKDKDPLPKDKSQTEVQAVDPIDSNPTLADLLDLYSLGFTAQEIILFYSPESNSGLSCTEHGTIVFLGRDTNKTKRSVCTNRKRWVFECFGSYLSKYQEPGQDHCGAGNK